MRTLDKHVIHDRVFTTQRLSRNLDLTPEGYLLCRNVGLARTGTMDYGPREVPDEMWTSAARDGRITVARFAEDVFGQQFVDSLNGKSVVVQHPERDVNPKNWKSHEVGVVLNPRRGEGVDADLLIGDFLIKDDEAIKYIRDHMPEVSVGYEADYQEYETGKWKQVPLIANHVALVDAGRCGSMCAIRDTGEKTMKTRDSVTVRRARRAAADAAWYTDWRVRLNNAIKVNDQKSIDAIMDEAQPGADPDGDDDLHIHLNGDGGESAASELGEGGARIDKLEGRVDGHDEKHAAHDAAFEEIRGHLGMNKDDGGEEEMAEEAPPGTSLDSIKGAKDSALFADGFQAVRAAAEILSPGIQLPVYDAKAPLRKTYDALCTLRRKALDRANLTPEGRDVIEAVTGGKPLALDGMKCGQVRTLFNSAAAVVKVRNVSSVNDVAKSDQAVRDTKDKPRRLMTAHEINEANRAHYAPTQH